MGYHIEKTIEISAPIEWVFGYTVDGENTPEWFEGVKSARRIAGKAGQKDSVVKYEYKIADIRLERTTEVLELDPP